MRILVVTAANEAFAPLLRGLVGSLCQWQPLAFDLACLDLGLGPATRDWLAGLGAHVVAPGWDLPVASALREREPHLRALTARPFLRDYFPGYDLYLWIDADAWVQERFALDWYVEAAAGGALAVTPQLDRAYRQFPAAVAWRSGRMQQCFGEEAARRALWDRYVNAGVFALPAGAPHWQAWARHFQRALEATGGTLVCDQTALNHMLWAQDLAAVPLPATCNWVCHLAVPAFDPVRQKFCEPFTPRRPLGILHLTGGTKDIEMKMRGDGWTRPISLRFPEGRAISANPPGAPA